MFCSPEVLVYALTKQLVCMVSLSGNQELSLNVQVG